MPRLAFISDIHANLPALEAVIDDVRRAGADRIICLGDIVGYGPQPSECVDLVFDVCDTVVMGNHDEAAVRPNFKANFYEHARQSIEFTRSKLSAQQRSRLQTVPDRARIEGVSLTHASFGERRFAYLYDEQAATESFAGLRTRVGVVGHTHVPCAFIRPCGPASLRKNADDVRACPLAPNALMQLPDDHVMILNPGSVGQPRDRNPDAAWGLLDTDELTFQVRRVSYDIEAVSALMRELGLPQCNSERLLIGA